MIMLPSFRVKSVYQQDRNNVSVAVYGKLLARNTALKGLKKGLTCGSEEVR